MYFHRRKHHIPKRAKCRKIMPKRAKLKKKIVPTDWFGLIPFEVRAMIINKMDVKTKCLFARCSKMCAEEVKGSEGFKLHISLGESQIFIGHDHDEDNYMYYLEFVEKRSCDGPKTEVIYFKSRKYLSTGIKKWKRLESGDAEEVQMRYFDHYVDEYQENIYKIEIKSSNNDFLAWRYDMRKLSKINKIDSGYMSDLLKQAVFDFSQIAYADYVSSPGTNVTFDQLINLKGQHYYLQAKCIKDQHISRYLKMLKKGKIGTNLKRLRLGMCVFRPNISEITEGLDVRHVNAELDEEDYIRGNDPINMFIFESDDPNIGCCECLITHYYMKITTGIDEQRLAQMHDI